jgi:hypothetical protein
MPDRLLVAGSKVRITSADELDEVLDTANVPEDAWQSLIQTTTPTNETLLAPRFFKVSYSSSTLSRLFVVSMLIILLLTAAGLLGFLLLRR